MCKVKEWPIQKSPEDAITFKSFMGQDFEFKAHHGRDSHMDNYSLVHARDSSDPLKHTVLQVYEEFSLSS